MKTIFKEPLLHFLLLGAALFALASWRAKDRPEDGAALQINVTAAVIERLRAGYERQFTRAPDAEELRGLVTAHIREEVLCREALALGLDRDDTIVRRRLAQKMEFLTDDLAGAAEPDEAAVQRVLCGECGALREAGARELSARLFQQGKARRGRGARGGRGAGGIGKRRERRDDGRCVFARLRVRGTRGAGDHGALWQRICGQGRGVARGRMGRAGRVELRAAPRPRRARAAQRKRRTSRRCARRLLRDFNEERRRTANREVFEKLRERYQVAVDEAALAKAAAAPTRTAQR